MRGLLVVSPVELQRVAATCGALGVGYVYYQVTGGSPTVLVGLWTRQELWRFNDDYVAYGPGVSTLRYGAILAGGIALFRFLTGERCSKTDIASLALLLALVLATSRISAMMAAFVAAAMWLFSGGDLRRRRVLAFGLVLITVFIAANFSRGGGAGVRGDRGNPVALAAINAQSYLATPMDATLQFTTAVGEGRYSPSDSAIGALGPLIPQYVPSTVFPDVRTSPVGRNVETRYDGTVDLAISLTTNSVLTDTLADYGWWALLSTVLAAGVGAWLAGWFAASGAAGAAIAGALLYGLAEYWRTYLFNSGGLHAIVLMGAGAALVGHIRSERSYIAHPAFAAPTVSQRRPFMARSGPGRHIQGVRPYRRWMDGARIVGWPLGAKILAVATGLAMAILTARVLEPAGRGAWVIAGLFAALPSLAAKGMTQATAFELGRRHSTLQAGQRDLAAVSWRATLPVMALASATAIAAAGAWSYYVGLGEFGAVFVGLAAVSSWLLSVPSGISLAEGDMRAAAAQVAVPPVLGTLAALTAFTVLGAGLIQIAVGWSVGLVVGSFLATRSVMPAHSRNRARQVGPGVQAQRAFGIKAGSAAAVNTVASRADVIMLGLIGSTAGVGVYSIAVTAAEMTFLLPWALLTAKYGALGRDAGPRALDLSWRLAKVSAAIGALQAAVLVIVAEPLVTAVFGPDYAEASGLLVWILPGTILMAATGPLLGCIVNHFGRPGVTVAIFGINAALTVAACALLIPTHGPMGAAVGTAVGAGSSSLVIGFIFWRLSRTGKLEGPPGESEVDEGARDAHSALVGEVKA